jgi:beta-glucosidase
VDAVIVVAGVLEKEGQDSASLDLTDKVEKLINAVGETGTPTVVVLTVGSAITMNDWYKNAEAILNAWYPGQEGGTAVAETIFGDNNPGGRLTITFPLSVAQCPLYYNYKPSGRGYGYVNMSGEPLYEFGYGLSYTTFEYSDMKLSKLQIRNDESLEIRFKVKNTGKVSGDEVIQLYIHDKVASTVRPEKELRRFQRVSLNIAEEKEITFTLAPKDLAIYNDKMEFVVEPGEFEIMIGSSSKDIRLRESVIVNK